MLLRKDLEIIFNNPEIKTDLAEVERLYHGKQNKAMEEKKMKMTIDAGIMQDMFKAWNRDYYTYEACEALIEWYDEIDPDTEFDVIGVCCDWNEYGNTPCLTWGAFLSDYDYLLEEADVDDDASDEEKREALIDALEDKTTVLRLSDSVLVMAF